MPPRFPHGLKQSPIIMSNGEKFVFGMLGISISAGILNLFTSPWSEDVTATEISTDGEQNSTRYMKKKPYPFSI